MSIKLVSVNIEQDKHLRTVKEFLAKENAEVICLQEVFEEDLGEIAPGYSWHVFAPNVWMNGKKMGVAIAAKMPFISTKIIYCDGKEQDYLPGFVTGVGVHRPAVVIVSLESEGKKRQIGTTHFTWTQDGLVTEQQRQDVERLLERIKGEELVLCGDFNLPRNLPGGNELYEKLAARLTDNIPQEITSSIDPELHRANKQQKGKLAWMVDYMWSTPSYKIENLRMECTVSDHCAIVADIV